MTTEDVAPSATAPDGSEVHVTNSSPLSPDSDKHVKREKADVLAVVDGLAAFTALHPTLGPSFEAISGPFLNSREAKNKCNEWTQSFDKKLQLLVTFRMRVGGTREPAKKRERRIKVECKKGCGYSWWYEKASDKRFYRQRTLKLTHGPKCLRIDTTPTANLVAGNFHIPEHLMKLALEVAPGLENTGDINDIICAKADREGTDIT